MRVLYIHNINRVAETYGKILARQGHIVTVYEPGLAGGASLLPIKLSLMPARVLSLRNIVSKLNANNFDLVHIHWASYGAIGLVSRVPYVVECHGSDVRKRLEHPFFRPVLTPILRRSAAVLCITPDLLPVVQAARPDTIFLPAPIDAEQFVPIEKVQNQPWTILLFARLDPEKGADIATQGIARFVERHPGVRVQLLDWGPLKTQYKRLYGDRFEFVPLVPQQEVQQLICSADVVVGQFVLGAIGLAELQAMSCARPVIASFRYPSAYSTPPPLCQAQTVEEIDQHLEDLFQYPEEASAIGQRARAWVINNHESCMLAARLENMYRTILEERT
ncbi:MAG TPA: glycosyltransferase family 4 protein [Ktedonobacteraceae bacterium]|nr:glycosyltransferase family 4 protein [Ktedonobacteraceae bacterium]